MHLTNCHLKCTVAKNPTIKRCFAVNGFSVKSTSNLVRGNSINNYIRQCWKTKCIAIYIFFPCPNFRDLNSPPIARNSIAYGMKIDAQIVCSSKRIPMATAKQLKNLSRPLIFKRSAKLFWKRKRRIILST